MADAELIQTNRAVTRKTIMAYEQKNNSGTLFVNERKETEKQPDFTGNVLIGKDLVSRINAGEKLRLAAWKKKTSGGKEIISISVSEERQQKQHDDVGF